MNSLKNYVLYAFDFRGVVSRKEFWPVFCVALGLYTMNFLFLFLNFILQIISILTSLFLMIPTTSFVVRRLHDTDRGAKNLLWLLVPLVGFVIVLIYLTEKTKYQIPTNN